MWAARLAKAAEQRFVRRLEINDLGRQRTLQRFQDGRQLLQSLPFADVRNQSSALDLRGFARELGKMRDELYRQVVDRVVTHVFKSFEYAGFTGARHAGDDHQLGL